MLLASADLLVLEGTRIFHAQHSQLTMSYSSLCLTPQIVDMSTSKTGKHGHAKVHLVAVDIFTTKKYEDISPSTHNMDVPNIQRNEYQLVNVDDGFLNLMTNDGDTKDDVRVPDGELGEQIQAAFDDGKDLMVTVVSAMGEEHCLSFKDAPQGK